MLAPQCIGMKSPFPYVSVQSLQRSCKHVLLFARPSRRQGQSLQADEEGAEPLRPMAPLLHVGGAVDAGGVASALGKTGPDPGAVTRTLFYLMHPVGQAWSGPASLRELGLARGARWSAAWAPPQGALGHCTLLSAQKAPRPRCVSCLPGAAWVGKLSSLQATTETRVQLPWPGGVNLLCLLPALLPSSLKRLL